MFSIFTKDLPSFIKIELEKLFQKINPLIKKNARYMMFAVPLLFISICNFIMFVFFDGFANGMIAFMIVYALMAAVGLALYRESKHIKKKIRELKMDHMVTRIEKSEVLNDYRKRNYISLIKSQPRMCLQTFMNFLTEEKSEEMKHFFK